MSLFFFGLVYLALLLSIIAVLFWGQGVVPPRVRRPRTALKLTDTRLGLVHNNRFFYLSPPRALTLFGAALVLFTLVTMPSHTMYRRPRLLTSPFIVRDTPVALGWKVGEIGGARITGNEPGF